MSVWLAWTRNALIAWAALTLFAGAATQLLAAIFGYAAHFGEPIASWYGRPLYDPWRFLVWGLELAPVRPWIAFLCVLLAITYALAAFAVLIFAGLFPPIELPRFKSRRGFATWDILSQQGLLAANGLASGAVRRLVWAKPDIVSAPAGNVALIGDPKHTDAALLAAISAWRGALVFVDARGLGLRLPRTKVIRFAPGRADSASYNPMLAIRGGAHAWADACRLARSFLPSGDETRVEAFAILVLDQLLTAPLDCRNLAAIRGRLAQPHRVLADICATWVEQRCAAPAPECEIARAVRVWRASPNATLAHLAGIDAALALFADGAYAQAEAHQFRFADLVAGDGAGTLVISPPPGDAEHAAPLILAMLAQLVRECASAPDVDHLGRAKKRELLVVIEAEALKGLAAGDLLPEHAMANGCRLLAQSRSMKCVPTGLFDTIAAIGPQTETSAAKLSELGGTIACWRRVRAKRQTWRDWVFPAWERAERAIVTPADLLGADASAAILFLNGLAPVAAHALCAGESETDFAAGANLSEVAHDWNTPAMSRPDAPVAEAPPLVNAQPIGAKIRETLTRRAPPRSPTEAKSP